VPGEPARTGSCESTVLEGRRSSLVSQSFLRVYLLLDPRAALFIRSHLQSIVDTAPRQSAKRAALPLGSGRVG
jgi:hypothetical protein